jgi:hypothetical protein
MDMNKLAYEIGQELAKLEFEKLAISQADIDSTSNWGTLGPVAAGLAAPKGQGWNAAGGSFVGGNLGSLAGMAAGYPAAYALGKKPMMDMLQKGTHWGSMAGGSKARLIAAGLLGVGLPMAGALYGGHKGTQMALQANNKSAALEKKAISEKDIHNTALWGGLLGPIGAGVAAPKGHGWSAAGGALGGGAVGGMAGSMAGMGIGALASEDPRLRLLAKALGQTVGGGLGGYYGTKMMLE